MLIYHGMQTSLLLSLLYQKAEETLSEMYLKKKKNQVYLFQVRATNTPLLQ